MAECSFVFAEIGGRSFVRIDAGQRAQFRVDRAEGRARLTKATSNGLNFQLARNISNISALATSGSMAMKPAKVDLDDRDYKILRELQSNGRIKVVDLAERISLSASPCFSRLKYLEEIGVIKGYAAVVDYQKLLKPVVTYAKITLSNHARQYFDQFERSVEKHPEVVSCHLISGDFDYLVKIVTRDIEHFHDFMEVLCSKENSVSQHFTFITIKEVKDRSIVPIDHLISE